LIGHSGDPAALRPDAPAAGARSGLQAVSTPARTKDEHQRNWAPLSEGRTFYFHSARMGCPTPREQAGQFIDAICDGRHKLVAEHYEAPRLLLYDLERDPEELHPLTSGPLLDELHQELVRARSASASHIAR
jgi:hypothetical protein